MTPKLTRCTVFLALALIAGQTSGSAGGDEAHVQAMELEHAADRPEASPAAGTEPRHEVDSIEVHYATLEDQKQVHGYLARPKAATVDGAPAILLIHEWWGLNDNIRAMADRFAGEGYIALAVDLYEGHLADTRDGAAALMRGTLDTTERLNDNLRQAHSYLVERAGATSVGSVGWCFGGGWSLRTAVLLGGDLDAAVIYYGRLITDPAELEGLEAHVLGLFGALDRGIPLDSVHAFESALRELNKPVEIHVYNDANHAFANPSGTRYDEAAAKDAWKRTLAFFAEHLK